MAGPSDRKDQRVPLAARVQIKTEGLEKFIQKFSGDISRGGMFIKTPTPLPIGKEIHLSVVVPGGTHLIEAKAKVTWVRTTTNERGEPPGMGIQFTSLGDGSEAVLEAILSGKGDLPPPPPVPAAPVKPTASVPPMGGSPKAATAKPATPAPAPAAAKPSTPAPAAPPKPTAPERTPSSPAPKVVVTPPPPPATAPTPASAKSDAADINNILGDIEEMLSDAPPPPAAAARPIAESSFATPGVEAKGPLPPAVPPMPAPAAESKPAPTAGATPGPAAPIAPAQEIVLGIDLGTTFSCAAFVQNGEVQVVPVDSGARTIPSVVTITSNDQVVGRAAYDRIATHPKNTIYGSKRLLGRKFISRAVQDARKYFDYEIVSDENGNAAVRIEGEIYPLVMVTSKILEEIRLSAGRHFGRDVSQAVICVPAYYNDNQRNAVIEAGRNAGFEVRRIVNEPVAAALAYGCDKGLTERILVYDLGGGTFDVSVMELNANVFDVVAAGGDPYLGGVDFDNRIVDFLVKTFKAQTGVDVSSDKVAILRLRAAAEAAKRDLSEKQETQLQLPYLSRNAQGQALNLQLKLTRADLEKLVADLVERTVTVCGEVLEAAGMDRSAINEVLLVGGQTRMPMIQSALTTFFNRAPRKGVHPDEAVAIGAALLAGSIDNIDSVVLLDVVSMSIGVGLPGGVYQPVLLRNSKLPATASTVLSTTKDGQSSMTVDLFQGDYTELSRNDYLGTIELEGFPELPAGQIRFQIVFRMDAQGFLVVTATELSSGITQQVTFRTRESPEALAAATA
ncbi:MAG TPA: TIGR02266 family protein [bacterium]|nr:TIGR02266 family protein [bacterium]